MNYFTSTYFVADEEIDLNKLVNLAQQKWNHKQSNQVLITKQTEK